MWRKWTLAEGFKVECSIGIIKQRKQFGEAHVARLTLPDYLSTLFRDSYTKDSPTIMISKAVCQ